MDELHINDFYRDCAVVLLRLYRSFPRKTSVYVGDLCGYEETDDIGLYSDRFQACFATISWLTEEGYIRHSGTIGQEAIELATLTHKAFSKLSAPSTAENLTVASQLHRAITNETSTEVGELTQILLDKLL